MPKEQQNAYKGGGMPLNEKAKRVKVRSAANHAVRDGKIIKQTKSFSNYMVNFYHKFGYPPLEENLMSFRHFREI